jgi:hypothetical protein
MHESPGLTRFTAGVFGRAALRVVGLELSVQPVGVGDVGLGGTACPTGYEGAADTAPAAMAALSIRWPQ